MTREEASELLGEYRGACADVAAAPSGQRRGLAMIRRDAIRERIIDAMTGEEPTQPLAGRTT